MYPMMTYKRSRHFSRKRREQIPGIISSRCVRDHRGWISLKHPQDFFLQEMEYFRELQRLSSRLRDVEPHLMKEGLFNFLLDFGEIYIQSATMVRRLHGILMDHMDGTPILPLGHTTLQLVGSINTTVGLTPRRWTHSSTLSGTVWM